MRLVWRRAASDHHESVVKREYPTLHRKTLHLICGGVSNRTAARLGRSNLNTSETHDSLAAPRSARAVGPPTASG
jgi:hypothetical protein